jgi:hypothetical protein
MPSRADLGYRLSRWVGALIWRFQMSSPSIARPREADRDFLAHFSSLTPEGRLTLFHAGVLTHHQACLWAGVFPSEVPLVIGEVPWIALGLADID